LIKSSDALGVLSSILAAVFWLRSAVIDVPDTIDKVVPELQRIGSWNSLRGIQWPLLQRWSRLWRRLSWTGSIPAPGVPAVYLFDSRVRGDHRPNSDVDVRLFLHEWKVNFVALQSGIG
jgi:hypothetical protein